MVVRAGFLEGVALKQGCEEGGMSKMSLARRGGALPDHFLQKRPLFASLEGYHVEMMIILWRNTWMGGWRNGHCESEWKPSAGMPGGRQGQEAGSRGGAGAGMDTWKLLPRRCGHEDTRQRHGSEEVRISGHPYV